MFTAICLYPYIRKELFENVDSSLMQVKFLKPSSLTVSKQLLVAAAFACPVVATSVLRALLRSPAMVIIINTIIVIIVITIIVDIIITVITIMGIANSDTLFILNMLITLNLPSPPLSSPSDV